MDFSRKSQQPSRICFQGWLILLVIGFFIVLIALSPSFSFGNRNESKGTSPQLDLIALTEKIKNEKPIQVSDIGFLNPSFLQSLSHSAIHPFVKKKRSKIIFIFIFILIFIFIFILIWD
jgi:flagellar basal body-associated protein FliL